MEGFEESQLYYTTPQANNQAENAGKSRGKAIFPADFLPGACRTGGRMRLFSGALVILCFRPNRSSAKKRKAGVPGKKW